MHYTIAELYHEYEELAHGNLDGDLTFTMDVLGQPITFEASTTASYQSDHGEYAIRTKAYPAGADQIEALRPQWNDEDEAKLPQEWFYKCVRYTVLRPLQSYISGDSSNFPAEFHLGDLRLSQHPQDYYFYNEEDYRGESAAEVDFRAFNTEFTVVVDLFGEQPNEGMGELFEDPSQVRNRATRAHLLCDGEKVMELNYNSSGKTIPETIQQFLEKRTLYYILADQTEVYE